MNPGGLTRFCRVRTMLETLARLYTARSPDGPSTKLAGAGVWLLMSSRMRSSTGVRLRVVKTLATAISPSRIPSSVSAAATASLRRAR
jgi:hypothetical protein